MTAHAEHTDSEEKGAQPQLPSLAAELLKLAEEAREYSSLLRQVRLTPAERGVQRASRHADYAAALTLRRVMGQYGWPGRTLVGTQGSRAACQIALRANHQDQIQRVALQQLHIAAQTGEAPWYQWAHLHDRCLLHSGDAQLYGTQYRHRDGSLERAPVASPERLDARRATVNLPPADKELQALRRRLEVDTTVHIRSAA